MKILLPKFLYKLTLLITIAVLALTLLSLFGRYPYLELSTHFRLQYVWISLICLVSLCLFRSWKCTLLTVFCLFFNGFFFLPYYSINHQEKLEPNLKLMLANVEGNNRNYEGLIQTVKSVNPDIIVLQEVTEIWWSQLQIFNESHPFSKGVPRAGGAGIAIFSRYPIENTELLTLDSSTHPALFSKIDFDGTIISLLTIHPPTPMRSDKFANRNEQFKQSAQIIKSASEPKLLIGDLNTTMWSPYFTDLIKDSELKDVRAGRGIYPSWHSILPIFLRIPLDHCLVSEKIKVENIDIKNTGSDHYALVVDLQVKTD